MSRRVAVVMEPTTPLISLAAGPSSSNPGPAGSPPRQYAVSSVLSKAEEDMVRSSFAAHCKGKDVIDMWELKKGLIDAGYTPSEDELFKWTRKLDDGAPVDYVRFRAIVEAHRLAERRGEDDPATLHAFVAMGGNPDKTGQISVQKMAKVLKKFGLTVEIEELIAELDTDKSGFVDFTEFAQVFAKAPNES